MDDERWRTAADRQEVSPMQNQFLIETEVAHRRLEWQRAVAAAAQRDQVRPPIGPPRWSQWVAVTRAFLRSLAKPRLPVRSWNPAGVQCARPLRVEVSGGGASTT